MNEIEVHNESDMLQGEINRMFVTDEMEELVRMYVFAQKRLERIYEYHYARLNND